MEGITADTMVSSKELAIVLGLGIRRVQQLSQDGVLDSENGRYHLAKSVARYTETITKKESETDKAKETLDLSLKRAKVSMVVMEAKEMQGKMHRSEDVADMTEDLVYSIRAMLVALPGRLAVDVIRAKSAAEAAEIIRKEVHKVMSELATYKYDPKKYEERVRERRKWDASQGDDDD
ncbi:hypothetical protein RFF05_06735 [Bengtsoniella intestinalis]|uniref:hypothetical protein n=1 Tax=Bengtsoniella intestinalis TaxID=3073143 RepID=UPI00391FB2E6